MQGRFKVIMNLRSTYCVKVWIKAPICNNIYAVVSVLASSLLSSYRSWFSNFWSIFSLSCPHVSLFDKQFTLAFVFRVIFSIGKWRRLQTLSYWGWESKMQLLLLIFLIFSIEFSLSILQMQFTLWICYSNLYFLILA